MTIDRGDEQFTGVFIPANIFLNDDLTSIEKVFWALIQSLAENQGCSASNKYLGKRMGRNPIWASKTVAKFKRLGLIEVDISDGYKRVIRVLSDVGK